MPGEKWSDEDNLRLAELRKGKGSMKELVSKFPGRSVTGLITHSTKLGLGARDHKLYATHFSWVEEMLVQVMKKHPGKTNRELSELFEASWQGIARVLAAGHGTKFHISGWTRYRANQRWIARWSLGEGEDAPKPQKLTYAECHRRAKERAKIKENAGNPFGVAIHQILKEAA
jgi:hypothetical protein